MKAFKKVSAWLLSLGMAVSLMAAVPVTAAPTTGSITVHKYVVETTDQYNKLKEEGDRSGGNVIDFSQYDDLKDLKPMEGITFDLEKVIDDGTTELDPKTAPQDTTFTKRTLTTDEDGELTFGELPLGTYRLSEQDDSRVKEKMDTVLISVPTYNQEYKTDTSKPEFLYDIHVYPKNLIHQDGPDIQKDVIVEENNDATVDRYAPFEWIILSDILPEVAEEKQTPLKYVITDKLDPRLDFVSDVSLAFRTAGEEPRTDIMEKNVDYTFTAEEVTEEEYKEDNQSSLTWTLTKEGLGKLKGYAGGQVVVKFETKINEKADLGIAIPNQAGLDYVNWNNHEYLPKSDIPEVHTGGIEIEKVDKSDNNLKLEGAEFMIYRSEEDAKEGDTKKAVQRDGNPYVVTSDSNGIAFFDGLSYGNTGDKVTEGFTEYWIVETKAPVINGEQYNRLREPFKVTVTATSHDMAPEDMYVVYNAKDNYKLPFTGGAGLIVFLGAGAVLLIAAYVVSKGGKSKAAK